MKAKNKCTNIFKFLLVMSAFAVSTAKVEALNVTDAPLSGVENAFRDPDVPQAIRVTSTGDGISAGTYLYRHVHRGVDYYSPVVPDVLRNGPADMNGGAYNNWGPWNMPANQAHHLITVTDYARAGRLRVNSTIRALVGGKNNVSVGVLNSGTNIDILSMSKDYVYFDLKPFSTLASKSDNYVGRVPRSQVTFTSSIEQVVYGTSDMYQKNFKRMAKYVDLTESYCKGATVGQFYNNSYAPYSVRNKYGEWRYLGYNAQGQPLQNPYFIEDSLSYLGNGSPTYYQWRKTPWDRYDVESGENYANEAYSNFTVDGRIQFPYNSHPDKISIMQRLYNEGIMRHGSPSWFKDRVALVTHPTKQSIILAGQRKTGDNGTTYNRNMMIENELRDLYLAEIRIIDAVTGQLVAHYTGSIDGPGYIPTGTIYPGRLYRAEIRIGNGANSRMIKNTLQSQSGLIYNASSVNTKIPPRSTYSLQSVLKGNSGGIAPRKFGLSDTMQFEFNVGESQTGHVDLYGYVGESHTGVDNLKYHNDVGAVRLKIHNQAPVMGDVGVYKIELINESGGVDFKKVEGNPGASFKKAIVPGKKYKIKYYAKYTGEDMTNVRCWGGRNDNPDTPQNEYVAPTCETYIESKQIPFQYTVRKYSGGTRDRDDYGPVTVKFTSNGSQNIVMRKGVEMQYETGYIMFQHPWLDTDMRITAGRPMNTVSANDTMNATINDEFDIVINNLVVKPIVQYTNGTPQRVNYNVSYGATLKVPDYVKSGDYQASINTAIIINGQTYNVKDQLVIGSKNNDKITHVINNVNIPSSGNVEVVVNLNSDAQSYESGNYSNNIGRTYVSVSKVKDPASGNPTDIGKPAENGNNDNPNKGGDANNNCLTPRTRNTWTSTHRKFSWGSNRISYTKIGSSSSVSFNKYNYVYENLNEATETYSEDYGIQKIMFRSKETKEKKYGNNGWINLLDSSQKDLAVIKAGYGFELQIVTRYSTDALTKRTWSTSNNGSSGTAVSALNSAPNYGLEDVFLELPGTTATRKILSSTGYGSTVLGLNASKRVNGSAVEWTYDIKPTNTLGVGETPKIYIPAEAKDGDYRLKIYTPPVTGVGSVNKKNYSALCDRKEVIIKVKGSAMNDLNSHETQ